ncbi:MAG: hypothetical protein KF841_14255 [Phycisphaerae bacterium]|nr:hypothetical protein [Phycisphaerae bacterium]
MSKWEYEDSPMPPDAFRMRRGQWLIAAILAALVMLTARLIWIGRAGLFVLAFAFVTGCTFHLVTVQVTPGAKAAPTSQPAATTQPVARKSFIEKLIEDLAD